MPIQFPCSACGALLEVPDSYAGHAGACYKCGQTITVPNRPTPPPEILGPVADPADPLTVAAPGLPASPAASAPPARRVSATAPPSPFQVQSTTPPAMFVAMGSPIPSQERVIWEGRTSLWYHLLRMVWSALWCVLWVYCYQNAASLVDWIVQKIPDVGETIRKIPTAYFHPEYVFAFFALLAAWGIVRRILSYLNSYLVFTSQRIKIRLGILNREFKQVELFRLKDFHVRQTIWGTLFNYAHVTLVSTEQFAQTVWLPALPGGPRLIEMVREAAQRARAESGLVTIKA